MAELGRGIGLIARTAVLADDGDLAELFNRAHRRVAGVVVRSEADIAWRCRRQPGMSPEGAILVEDKGGRLLGYAFVKDNGDIIEFAVEPEGPQRHAATELINACEQRAVLTGAERIRINVPHLDVEVEKAMRAAGLIASEPEARQYVASTQPLRFAQAAASQAVPVPTFVLRISDSYPWQQPEMMIGTEEVASLRIEADQRTVNRLMIGGESPLRAVFAGDLKVKPFRKTITGIRIVRRLQLRSPWVYTLGDVL